MKGHGLRPLFSAPVSVRPQLSPREVVANGARTCAICWTSWVADAVSLIRTSSQKKVVTDTKCMTPITHMTYNTHHTRNIQYRNYVHDTHHRHHIHHVRCISHAIHTHSSHSSHTLQTLYMHHTYESECEREHTHRHRHRQRHLNHHTTPHHATPHHAAPLRAAPHRTAPHRTAPHRTTTPPRNINPVSGYCNMKLDVRREEEITRDRENERKTVTDKTPRQRQRQTHHTHVTHAAHTPHITDTDTDTHTPHVAMGTTLRIQSS